MLWLSVPPLLGIQRARLVKNFKAKCLRKVQELPPLRSRETGSFLGFPGSPSMPLRAEKWDASLRLSSFSFFKIRGHSWKIAFFSKSQLSPAKLLLLRNDGRWNPMWHWAGVYGDTPPGWGSCRCSRKVVCGAGRLCALVWDHLSLVTVALPSEGALGPVAPSPPAKGHQGHCRFGGVMSGVLVSRRVRSLVNSCAPASGCLGISGGLLFQTLISCFNFLSLRIGSKSFSLLCCVLKLHSDKQIKRVLSGNLSISIIRNTPHKGWQVLCLFVLKSPQESVPLCG